MKAGVGVGVKGMDCQLISYMSIVVLMTEKELDCWLGFSAFPGIGPLRFRLLVKYFGSVQKAWNASRKNLAETGLGSKIAEHFDAFRETFKPNDYRKLLDEKNIWVITFKDTQYPPPLAEIESA